MLDRMIIVPGSKVERSKLSHDCRFTKIGDSWSWDSPEREAHVIRNQQGAKTIMQTVTLVPAREGLGIDIIGQQMRTGAHRVREVHSYEFKAGELVLVSARAIGDSASH